MGFFIYGNLKMGTFVISKRFNGEYKFVFTSRKGKVIFTSNSYPDKSLCEADIMLVKDKATRESFNCAKAAGGKYFFKLYINEVQMALSRKYTTELLMKKGIDEIINSGSKSEVLDFSETESIFPEM